MEQTQTGIPASFALSSINDLVGFSKESKEIEITIPEGYGLSEISELLKETGVIDEPFTFEVYARIKEMDKRLAPGTYTMKEILVPVFLKGECVYESPSVMDIRAFCQQELNTLWDETRRLVNPHKVHVDLSPRLYDMKISLLDQLGER